jgi:hypothetical protein
MLIPRRTLGLQSAALLLVGAMPQLARADAGDVIAPNNALEGHRQLRVNTQKHTAGKVTTDHIKYDWSIDFSVKDVAKADWKYDFPQNGQASVLIDDKGNWQFSGSFPKDPLKQPCEVNVAITLKSKAGKVYAFSHAMNIFHDGASWSKSGHDQVVQDLWNDILGGYGWVWGATARQVPQNAPPPPSQPSLGCVGGDLGQLLQGLGMPCNP